MKDARRVRSGDVVVEQPDAQRGGEGAGVAPPRSPSTPRRSSSVQRRNSERANRALAKLAPVRSHPWNATEAQRTSSKSASRRTQSSNVTRSSCEKRNDARSSRERLGADRAQERQRLGVRRAGRRGVDDEPQVAADDGEAVAVERHAPDLRVV